MKEYRIWVAFLLLGSIWGASFLFIKIALNDLGPLTLVSLRLGLGAVTLWIISLSTGLHLPADRRLVAGLLLLGLLQNLAPFSLISWGQQYIDSGVTSILNSATPLFTLIVGHFALQDEHITWHRLGGLLLGFVGIIAIFSRELEGGVQVVNWSSIMGMGAIVTASACYGVAAVLTRRYFRGVEPKVVAVLSISAAAIASFLLAVVFEAPYNVTMGRSSLFAILWLSILGTGIANLLLYFLIREWGATRTTLVTYVIPVIGVCLGILILREPADWQLFVGFALVIGAIAIVNSKKSLAASRAAESAV